MEAAWGGYLSVGDNLRRIRKDRGFGQIALAEASGVSQPTISEIETGQRDPHQSTLSKLADALGVPLAAFFTEGSAPQGSPPEPKTPLTVLSEQAFDRRLRGADTESKARSLRDSLDAEITALSKWYRALVRTDAPPGDVLLARQRRRTALKRYNAAALLWSEFVAESDELRERPVERAVAEAGAEDTARRAAAERRKFVDDVTEADERQRVEEAGKSA
jgi:transcriptional regulator with XRE-family HTH domain